MAGALYVIVDTNHPFWPIVLAYLTKLRPSCVPTYSNDGSKAILNLKKTDAILPGPVNMILNNEGVYGAGDKDWLHQQDLSDWRTF